MGVLHKLEQLTKVTFCRFCFSLGGYCRCSSPAPLAQTQFWDPPVYSYASIATATATMASTSAVGVPTLVDSPPGYSTLPQPVDLSWPSKDTNLPAGAGVGRGMVIQRMQARSRMPGFRQGCPRMSTQQRATPEVIQATPYRQQVFQPRPPQPAGGVESRPATTATQASTSTTSTGTASGTEAGARGRT